MVGAWLRAWRRVREGEREQERMAGGGGAHGGGWEREHTVEMDGCAHGGGFECGSEAIGRLRQRQG